MVILYMMFREKKKLACIDVLIYIYNMSVKKEILNIFVEPDLRRIMRAQSLQTGYAKVKGHRQEGSTSWYARRAVVDRILKDFPEARAIKGIDWHI